MPCIWGWKDRKNASGAKNLRSTDYNFVQQNCFDRHRLGEVALLKYWLFLLKYLINISFSFEDILHFHKFLRFLILFWWKCADFCKPSAFSCSFSAHFSLIFKNVNLVKNRNVQKSVLEPNNQVLLENHSRSH